LKSESDLAPLPTPYPQKNGNSREKTTATRRQAPTRTELHRAFPLSRGRRSFRQPAPRPARDG